jgi:hypothetical protein
MSLAALNTPPLVATAGAGTLLLLPILEKAIENGSITWGAMKAINACAYAVNFLAVQAPGRIDGMQPEEKGEAASKKTRSESKEMEPLSTGRTGKTLVAPSGW